jgi:hypothetical protein
MPEQMTRQEISILGRLPHSQEIKLTTDIQNDFEEAYSRTFLPFVLFDRELVKVALQDAKKKLEMLV